MAQVGEAKGSGSGSKPPSGTPISGSYGSDFSAMPPDTFPNYTVAREIHRGGQGVVYLAIHKSTKRKVAIKVLREGPFASKKERIRFEREVDILAQLNHPNIVTIHDSGSLPGDKGGLQYLVMDYISGRSLDAFLADSKLGVPQILELFSKIGDAVNAAHLKGVIHRDLKPSNIRVDNSGEPHILDFGLAKISIGDSSDGAEDLTMTGQFIGSLAWASPEQAEMSAAKIDTRTDVYSLGVMLYAALTGRYPYTVLGNMRDVLDNILKVTPAKPSSMARRINNEVETIVLKCLSKERERRYQNAGELARDLRSYLEGRPIEAKRDSLAYLLRKGVARHRVPATAAGLVLLAIIGASVISTAFWRQAVTQRDAAIAAKNAEAEARRAAEAATTRATLASEEAEKTSGFLELILANADASQLTGSGPTPVIALINQAAIRAEAELSGKPVVLARVLDTLGRAFGSLGKVDVAETMLNRALALRKAQAGTSGRSKDVALSLASLGELRLGRRSDARGAFPMLQEAYDMSAALAGAESEQTSEALLFLARAHYELGEVDTAQKQMQQVLALRTRLYGGDSVEVAEVLTELALIDERAGRLDDAISKLTQAHSDVVVHLTSVSVNAATVEHHLVDCYLARGSAEDVAKATQFARTAASTYTKLFQPLDPDSPWIARGKRRLAMAMAAGGDARGAEDMYRQGLGHRERDGTDAPATAIYAMELGSLLREAFGDARLDDSITFLRQAKSLFDATRGEEHPDTARCNRELGLALLAKGDVPGAEALCRKGVVKPETQSAAQLALSKAALARVLVAAGKATEAASLIKGVADTVAEAPTLVRANVLLALGGAEAATGMRSDAIGHLRDARDLALTSRDARGYTLKREILTQLANVLRATGKVDDAVQAERTRDTLQAP
ncbi:MAG: serine/threonine-protein kinase [Phycisphaerales bacterium]|jgi:tRNA A-37 threonylcarbamoyl transferase component Bud32/tetratricopeptide (TPR) repeat protein